MSKPKANQQAGRDIIVQSGNRNSLRVSNKTHGSDFWAAIVATVIGGIIVAYVIFKLGWS